MPATVGYTARFVRPERYERARANTFDCEVWLDGALVAPTAAGSSLTIYDRAGTAVVSAAAVTVTGSIAEVTAGAQVEKSYEDGWVWEWSLVMAGVLRVFRNTGALVRNDMAPPATDQDLYEVVSALDPAGHAPITRETTFQTKLDKAWVTIWKRIERDVRHPWRIINAAELLDSQVLLTLALIFEDLSTRLNLAHAETAKMYRAQFDDEFAGVALIYDEGDDGQGDPDNKRAGRASGWDIGPPARSRRWGW
jgi:hypothetical protein